MVPQLSTILQLRSIGIYFFLIGMLSNIKDCEGHGSRLYPHLCWFLSNGKNNFDYIIQNRLKTFVLTTILRWKIILLEYNEETICLFCWRNDEGLYPYILTFLYNKLLKWQTLTQCSPDIDMASPCPENWNFKIWMHRSYIDCCLTSNYFSDIRDKCKFSSNNLCKW